MVNATRSSMITAAATSSLEVLQSPRLGSKIKHESSNAVQIGGVGDTTTQALGMYSIKIPMHSGQSASLSGTCLQTIATTFAQYPLDEAYKDICQSFQSTGGNQMLPKPSLSVGGDIHFMIGVKYLRYHPKLIYQLPSGLAIYESVFNNADGGTGVIGGPHPIFTKINQHFFNQSEVLEFCSSQYKLFKTGIKVDPGITMLSFPSNLQKRFEAVEMAGSEITYRCNNCRKVVKPARTQIIKWKPASRRNLNKKSSTHPSQSISRLKSSQHDFRSSTTQAPNWLQTRTSPSKSITSN